VTNANPVAYWRLNETNGTTVAADFLRFHSGTFSTAVTPGVSGPQSPAFPGFETNNTAMQFNYTSGSYLTMPALNLDTNTVTIVGWINPTGTQAGWSGIAFCRGGTTCAGLHFGPESNPNELRYTWNNSRWDKSTGLAAPAGQWSFVALVVTPTNGTIYLGTAGVLNSYIDTNDLPSQAFDASLLIGFDPSSGSRLFRGVIDEVAIYNRSLSSPEIQQLYASALSLRLYAPSNLTATAVSANQINLTWSDNSSDEDGFKIERSTDGTNFVQIAQVLPNTTSYCNTGLWPGRSYYYRISAYNSVAQSDFSSVAMVRITDLCPAAVFVWGNYSNAPANLTDIVAMAAGYDHSLALKRDGSVVGWGNNYSGQAMPPAGLSDVVAIAAGEYYSLALKSDGTVAVWGSGQAAVDVTNIVAIAAGSHHSLALRSDGTVVGWGANYGGQATPPTNLTGIVGIAAGVSHSLALRSDGTVVGWGDNSYGQLSPPTGLSNVVMIAAGGQHSVALKRDGTVTCWGYNYFGQATVPAGTSNVVSIVAGLLHTLALKKDGTITGWGENSGGQAIPLAGLRDVMMIAAGQYHNLALVCKPASPSVLTATAVSSSQINLSWTDNSNTETGFKIERAFDSIGSPGTWFEIAEVGANATSYSDIGLPASTKFWYRVRAYRTGADSDFSSQASSVTLIQCPRVVIGWGSSAYGQAAPPAGLTTVVAIAARDYHSLALKSDGTVIGWGDNGYGQSSPPAGLSNVIAIATGPIHSLALRTDGTVLGWGDNGYGKTTPPAGLSNVVAIAAGSTHSLALKTDGTVVGWGHNSSGEATPPAGLSNVTAIAAGYSLSLALRSDGTVVGWGFTGLPPVGLSNVAAIAACGTFGLALKTDGTIIGWGDNGYGQSSPPAGLSNVVAIAAGSNHSLALTHEGTIVGWGDNDYGQAPPQPILSNVVAIAAGALRSVALTLPCSLAAPSPLKAVGVPTDQVNLSWIDNSLDEAGFEIEKAPDVGGNPGTWAQIASVSTNVISYSDTGLLPGMMYWYRVRGYNTVGNSDYSNVASIMIPPLPAAPTGLATNAVSSSQMVLTWIDNANNEDGFQLERASDIGGSPGTWMQIATAGSNIVAFTDIGLSEDTKLWYRVRAYNVGGVSAYSDVASGRTLLRSPTNLTATAVSSNRVDLTWIDNSNVEDGYSVERAPDAGGNPGGWVQIATIGVNSVGYTDLGLSPNTKYWYRVRAYNSGGVSSYSSQENARTLPLPPATPLTLTATVVSSNQINLGWVDSANSELGFIIERALDNGGSPGIWTQIVTVVSNVTAYSDTTLSANHTYWYRVRAYNTGGDSDYSNEASAKLPSLPLSPSGLVAVSGKQINLSWSDNADNETGFKIERAPDAGGNPGAWTQIATVVADVTNYFSTGLLSNTAYWYRIRAYNITGNSDYSNEAKASTPNIVAPSALTVAVVSTKQLVLYWTDNTGVEDGFEIERALDSFGTPVGWMQIASAGANITNHNDVGLAANTKYWYRVRAYQSSESSDYSTPASGTTPVVCPRVVVGWGDNGYGQATPPTNLELVTAISAGPYNSLALKSDGSVVPWGNGPIPPAGLSNVIAIAAGDYFSLALKSDGTVTNWGDSYYGKPPIGLSNVIAIAAGGYFGLALKSDGTVTNWGDSYYGKPPSGLNNVVAISARSYNGLGLRSDGTVVAWGYAPTPPAGLNNVVAIAVGYFHCLVLKSDGTVVGWGSSSAATPPWGLSNVVSIAAGSDVSLALKKDGTVVGWGSGSAATSPAGLSHVIAIAAGYYHGLALTTPCSLSAPSPLTATAVSSTEIKLSWLDNSPDEEGFKVERALDNAGSPGSWIDVATVGTNETMHIDSGLIPNTTYWYRVRAYSATGNSGYTDPAAAITWNLTPPSGLTAVSTNEIALSWVDNNVNEDGFRIERAPDVAGAPGIWAQIGTVVSNTTTYTDAGLSVETKFWYRVRAYNATGSSDYSVPVSAIILPAPSNLIAVVASYSQINLWWSINSINHTAFKIERSTDGINFTQIALVLSNTTAYRNTGLWPDTTYYYRVHACNGASYSDSSTASATTLDSCATSIVAWGSGYLPPTNLTGVVAIADASNHSLALKSDGTVVSWPSVVVTAPGLTQEVAIAAGYYHGLALNSDGTVVSWGDNLYGQANTPPSLSNVVSVVAGYYHNLALRSDGTVVGWGRNDYNQATPRPGLNGVVAIAAGYYHSLALESDGTVAVWGRNNYGQTNAPAGLSGVVAVAAGYYHSLALKSDGTVVGWGDNTYGQSTPPTNLTGVVAIGAGQQHSLALKSDGTVVAWGESFSPQEGLTAVVAVAATHHHSLFLTCAPSAPTSLKATGGVNRIDLTWNDSSYTEDRFGVERRTSSTGTWTEVASVGFDVTSYSDAGLSCGQTNYYRVRAYNSYGGSPYSSVVNTRASPDDTDCDEIPNDWTQRFFGHQSGEAGDNSRAVDDADGDGQNNLVEFTAGTDPTNSASAFRILEIAPVDDDMLITWAAVGGKWYIVQTATNFTGSLSNSFYDLNPVIIAPGTGEYALSVLHLGAATNAPVRFYRVRLVP
jgi:titin